MQSGIGTTRGLADSPEMRCQCHSTTHEGHNHRPCFSSQCVNQAISGEQFCSACK